MIELKNIKVHLGLSEETYAYTATVWFKGKKAIDVSNQGHGGCDHQDAINPDGSYAKGGHARVEEINKWCAKNLPQWKAGNDMHDSDLEIWCGEQVDRHLKLRDMKALLRKRPAFVKKGGHGLFELSFKGHKKYDPRMAEVVRKDHPHATILNELPEAEAFALYCEHA